MVRPEVRESRREGAADNLKRAGLFLAVTILAVTVIPTLFNDLSQSFDIPAWLIIAGGFGVLLIFTPTLVREGRKIPGRAPPRFR